jgi:hypothetical protein
MGRARCRYVLCRVNGKEEEGGRMGRARCRYVCCVACIGRRKKEEEWGARGIDMYLSREWSVLINFMVSICVCRGIDMCFVAVSICVLSRYRYGFCRGIDMCLSQNTITNTKQILLININ